MRTRNVTRAVSALGVLVLCAVSFAHMLVDVNGDGRMEEVVEGPVVRPTATDSDGDGHLDRIFVPYDTFVAAGWHYAEGETFIVVDDDTLPDGHSETIDLDGDGDADVAYGSPNPPPNNDDG